MIQRTRNIPYNQAARQNNFFNRATESPFVNAGNQIVRGNSGSNTNLPTVGKQQNGGVGSVNDTKDSINNQEVSRRSSHGGFNVRKPNLGEPDFDYSSLNMNLR